MKHIVNSAQALTSQSSH